MSLMVGAASVVVIYYQQTLAKYIITQTSNEQYKWFGIIVGCIVFRFLAFNVTNRLMLVSNGTDQQYRHKHQSRHGKSIYAGDIYLRL